MSDENKLSFLNKDALDAKKSELSSLFGKKKEEPKAEPKVEVPAHIRVKAEIDALDRKTPLEREAYAENALKMIEECKEDVQRAGAVYKALETAIYLVDDVEMIKSLAQLMYEIMWGDLGKKCFITGAYTAEVTACSFAGNMTESIANEKGASLLTMVYALLDYHKKVLERLDSVRHILDKDAYNELCDYYEISFENLGESLQKLQACVLGQDADSVYTRHMPALLMQKNRKLFEFHKDIAEGCSDWKRECIASAYAKYFRGTTYGNNIVAIYSGEVLFLADAQDCHYAKRSAEKFERHLEKEGCITVGKKATGNFAGEIGSRLREAERTFDKYSKREKLGAGATACMVLGCLLLLGLAAAIIQAIRSRIIYDRYKTGARMGFLREHLKELEECEDCAQTMLETAKKTGSVGIVNYYTAVLETARGFKTKYEKVLK